MDLVLLWIEVMMAFADWWCSKNSATCLQAGSAGTTNGALTKRRGGAPGEESVHCAVGPLTE